MTAGRAVVAGGGLAGIAAALELARAGAAVTLLEVRPRLGGAAYSFERDGLALDNGQHVFLRCCVEYRRLLGRLGVERDTVLQRRLEIPVLAPGGRRATIRRAALPAPLHLAPALARYRPLSPRERLSAARTALALGRLDLDDPTLDGVSFGDWLRARGESPAAVAALWNLIALPTINLDAGEASLALAAMVFKTGLLDGADAGDIGYARVPLSDLHDRPAQRALAAAGVDVRLRSRVVAVDADNLAVETERERFRTDTVIVALPHDRAADVVPPAATADPGRLKALGRSPIVNLHVVYDRRVMDLPFAAGVGTPVQYVFDRTRRTSDGHQYVAVSLSAAEREMRMSPTALRAEFVPALERLLPRARGATVERFEVTREHAATFRGVPGSAALRPPATTAVPGLFLAGAWTATGWPATMEGAVRSGLAAARAASERLEGLSRALSPRLAGHGGAQRLAQ